ncbi:MAG: acyl carrier protein [Clostridia bacterium]|nr:acyl carrier protein [Clostridia bacterium]
MVFDKIRTALTECGFDGENADADSSFETLGMGSLDIVEFVMALEELLDAAIDDDAVHGFATLGDVFGYIEANS